MRSIEIKTVQPDNRDLHMLIDKLDREMLTMYPAEGIFGVDFTDPKVREMTFYAAYISGTPAGCGALRPLGEGMAELKRFFVEKDFRGKGIASVILETVETMAAASGITVIRLETGPKQHAAIALYRKFGYREIELFGPYIGCEYSYCMEKQLPADGGTLNSR